MTPRKPNLSRQPTNPSVSNSGHAAGDENARRRDRKLAVASSENRAASGTKLKRCIIRAKCIAALAPNTRALAAPNVLCRQPEGLQPRLPADLHRDLRRCSSTSLTSSWCSTGGGNNPSSTSLRLAASIAVVTSIAFSIDTTLRIGAACYLLVAAPAMLLVFASARSIRTGLRSPHPTEAANV